MAAESLSCINRHDFTVVQTLIEIDQFINLYGGVILILSCELSSNYNSTVSRLVRTTSVLLDCATFGQFTIFKDSDSFAIARSNVV